MPLIWPRAHRERAGACVWGQRAAAALNVGRRRGQYFSPMLLVTSCLRWHIGACHMPPCVPATCHSARRCVFLELKLDSHLA